MISDRYTSRPNGHPFPSRHPVRGSKKDVNASDAALCKSHIGQPLDTTNFRSDVNANGAINGSDVSIVKSQIGIGSAAGRIFSFDVEP